jgi:tetratricopeptide (TPR) repeat protein
MNRSILLLATLALSGCATIGNMVDAVVDPMVELVSLEDTSKALDERSIKTLTQEETRQAERRIADTVAALSPAPSDTMTISGDALNTAIVTYQRLLENTQSDAIRQEALQKLAELSVIKAEQLLESEDDSAMQQQLARAEDFYQVLMRDYPAQINATQTKYQMARVNDLQGETEQALALINELANSAENSAEVIEARFRLAERFYAQKQYPDAQALYDQVLAVDNRFYNSALFKRGWTHFQRQNFDYALNDYISLIARIYELPGQRTDVIDNLLKETYRVSALSLSYLDGPQSLAEYFQAVNSGQLQLATDSAELIDAFEADLYMGLAALYEQQERLQDTANTYITFVRENPFTPSAPLFEHKGIEVLSKSGFVDLVLKAKEDFVLTYQANAPYWTETGLERSSEVAEMLFEHLDNVTTYYHAQAQKNNTSDGYLLAASWYQIFLDSFPAHPDVDNRRWLLAEALHDGGNRQQSLEQYEILAYQANTLTAERKEEAGFRLLLGAQEHHEKLKDIQSISLLIDESKRYLTNFITSVRAADVAAQTIELHLEANDITAAIELAGLVNKLPGASPAQKMRAAIVIANGEFDLGNYLAAELAYSGLIENPSITAEQRLTFRSQRAKAIFQQADALKKNGQIQAAISMFAHLAKTEPDSPERKAGDYDAAMLALNDKQYETAILMLKAFAGRFPADELTASIPASLLIAYEATENWAAAATEYEALARRSSDPEVKRTALWQAAEKRMKLTSLTELDKSTSLWKEYIKVYPQPVALALEARQNLINLYGQMTEIGDENLKWKQDFWRRKIITEVDANQLTDTRARALASDALMSIVKDKMERYRSMRLTQPLADSLKKKRSLMDALLSDYSKVMDYGMTDHVTEAGHRLGEIYALLAKAMLDSERPKGMTDIELEEYDLVLEEKVFPVEDQAIAAYENHVSLTRDGLWNNWIEASYSALSTLMPGRYSKQEVIDDYAE